MRNLRFKLTDQTLISDQRMKDSESQLQEKINKLNNQIDALKKEVDGNYNSGVEYCYDYIIAARKMSHPELNMDDLVEAINEYIKEKEGKRKLAQAETVDATTGDVEGASLPVGEKVDVPSCGHIPDPPTNA